MSVSQAQLDRAIAQARVRESHGYFDRVRAGDQRAASLFVRLVAHDLNPHGFTSEYGWLSKTPGETNVDGYAEDAICGNADSTDWANVVDLVNGAGASGASIGGSVKQRRFENRWVTPQPLSDADLAYLLEGSHPVPQPPQYPSYEELGGDEGGKKITRVLEHDYRWAMRPGLDGECGAWMRRTDYDFLAGLVKPVEASIVKHRDEWLYELGLIRVEHGMMANGYICKICGASVGVEKGKPIPLIPHAGDCMTKPITA